MSAPSLHDPQQSQRLFCTPAEFQAWRSRRAQRHGRSMEEEVRVILAQAVARDEAPSSHTPGLGSRMAALFADVGLEEPISEWRGVEPVPALFEP
ncbi:MAG: FitA-like ribbon-helix-helix domain-containing protein [Cyanobium sp.]